MVELKVIPGGKPPRKKHGREAGKRRARRRGFWRGRRGVWACAAVVCLGVWTGGHIPELRPEQSGPKQSDVVQSSPEQSRPVQVDGVLKAPESQDRTSGRSGGRLPQITAVPKRSELVVRGRVTHIRDGDTIEVSGTPIRIANLDCAEAKTRAGRRATEWMRRLVGGSRLICDLEGRMSYDREVGTCALGDGRDIGDLAIGAGVCGRWRG